MRRNRPKGPQMWTVVNYSTGAVLSRHATEQEAETACVGRCRYIDYEEVAV